MTEDHLIRYCAPTLAGIKTASLFTCAYESQGQLLDSIRRTNQRLHSKGLRILPLRFSEKKALIYIYRPRKLSEDLTASMAAEVLVRCGYDPTSCENCVVRLGRKLRQHKDFPHEIGLFLGYPPEDVCGFMENHACGCKCVGCWKVYGDEVTAKKKFAQYKKCDRIYRDRWEKGADLERLTVG